MAYKELVAVAVLQAVEDGDDSPLRLIQQALQLAKDANQLSGWGDRARTLLAMLLLLEVAEETVQGERVSQQAALKGKDKRGLGGCKV